ncbi:MAG: prenyltransferase [Patescibacteria group bacterium]|nr:prenyltransferase [Patescibacteria group bacterium]
MSNTLRYLFLSSRPISWLNTAYPFAAGYLLVTHNFTIELLLGTLYFLIPYNLLLYGINDVFDYESDILNPRKGGLEGAKLAKSQHKGIIVASLITNVPCILGILLWGSTAAKLTFLFVICMVLAYSVPKLRFKEIPFLDSVTSSTHFSGPLVYALVLTGWEWSYVPYVAAFFLWGMASHAFGAVQDIPSDRKGALSSIGTVLGAKVTVRFAAALYVLAFVALLGEGTAALLCGLTSFFYCANVARYFSVNDATAEQTNPGWRRFIWLNMLTGFTITMVLIQVYLGNLA